MKKITFAIALMAATLVGCGRQPAYVDSNAYNQPVVVQQQPSILAGHGDAVVAGLGGLAVGHMMGSHSHAYSSNNSYHPYYGGYHAPTVVHHYYAAPRRVVVVHHFH